MTSLEEIRAAATRLAPYINRTPLLESPFINERLGGRLLLKAESLQKTGSFKFRGATNRIAQLTPAEREGGVVAWSSGNHAQGVALAAKLHHVAATIVMPADAPEAKIHGTEAAGATLVLYDRARESREEIGTKIAEEKGAIIIPPFDDPHIIAGQGTTGLEALIQAAEYDAQPDLFLAPCSGGGLSSGCSVALAALSPQTKVIVAEPEHYGDTGASLAAGEIREIVPGSPSLCDALMQPRPGLLTFPLLVKNGATGVTVSDAAVKDAMRLAFHEFRLVAEPGGAAALAAVVTGLISLEGRTAIVVLSGGNVDADLFARILSE